MTNKLLQHLANHIDICIQLDDKKKVVLIETSEIIGLDNHLYNANIYCIDNENNIIWQVDSDKGLMEKDSFVFIKKVENGIVAQRFFGTEYFINPVTGLSKKIGWNK